jgi:serine/threonine-protein kinase
MDTQLWSRAHALFDELEDLPPARRDARLATACAGDEELLAAVQRLFEAAAQIPETLQDPLARAIGESFDRLAHAPAPGRRFGPFAILEEIGRGGMGAVYLAERRDGAVQQRVALKIVAHATHDAAARERMQRERNLLAALEHPHIARLIDAGEDEHGVPYFAMEHVRGLPITRYADAHRLGLRARLQLFRQVCAAVQFAHANLVVHRDLKAANILVTEQGTPKLLDFGIATTLSPVPADTPESAQRFLSPNAAAPEQFLGHAGSVAMDVYALGALLHELVCARPLFDFTGMDYAAIEHTVLHAEPPPPSVVAAGLPVEAAQARGERNGAHLTRRLRGDVDAIVARSLRKGAAERYASVEQLDADVGRYLDGLPISLRADEPVYRAGKFLRRHRIAVGFGSALAIVLLSFAVVATLQSRRLAQERDQAQFERDRAEQVSGFLVDLFRASDPEQARGREVTAKELLGRGTQRLDTQLKNQPGLRASLLSTIADIHLALDDLDAADAAAEEAARLRRELQPPDAAANAASLTQLARLANQHGRFAAAKQFIDAAQSAAHLDAAGTSTALQVQATALEGLGKTDDAIAAWRAARAASASAYSATDPRQLKPTLGLIYALRARGLADEAETLLGGYLPQLRRALADDDPRLGEALLALAAFARNKHDYARADALATEALGLYERVYGDKSSAVASAANTLATIAQASGDVARSRTLFERALRIRRDIHGAEHPRVASAEYNLGLLLLGREHDAAEALPHLQAAVDIGAKRLSPDHVNLATYRLALGSAQADLQQPQAGQTLELALAAFDKIHAPRGIDMALTRGELACLALSRGPDAGQLAQLDTALKVVEENLPADDPQRQRVAACRQRHR